ncbi:MAG: ATP-dependent DNA ligase [Aquabacterium sp.]|jgi:DNA ligase-1|nr:MAG: ATP-dependent DNA ligase [Aquabacterium sp.]
MQLFSQLFTELDAYTATRAKLAALVRYFAEAPPADAAWAVYFLAGGKPRQVLPTARLREWACEAAGIEDWLFEASYQTAGDLAETIAHLLPPPDPAAAAQPLGLAHWVEERLLPMKHWPPERQREALRGWWATLDWDGRFLLTKLIGGGFRVGVSRLLVIRALAAHARLDPQVVAQRMVGWTSSSAQPTAERYLALVSAADPQRDAGQPYPFFLAHPLDPVLAESPHELQAALGPVTDWLAEWKYDGIRGQVVARPTPDGNTACIWSRGEELVSDRFPELVAMASELPPGTVLDGEILVWRDEAPATFALLQQRITRKTLTRKLLADAPVAFVAYDLLEQDGADLRTLPQRERRARLEALAAAMPQPSALKLSPLVSTGSWEALAAERLQSRARGVEGLMLKRADSGYGIGRTKAQGLWWKWKIDPMTADAVLIYAQRGHGRRAGLYTDYTFAVWNRPPLDAAEAQAVIDAIERREPARDGALQLVAFAKAYSGLTDAEFTRIDRVIQQTTLEKFGPVRSVKPSLVFELAFEGIQRSPRHKSGIALRFPRMLRIREDKPLHEADTLASLEALLKR